jgi:hypothetical protein
MTSKQTLAMTTSILPSLKLHFIFFRQFLLLISFRYMLVLLLLLSSNCFAMSIMTTTTTTPFSATATSFPKNWHSIRPLPERVLVSYTTDCSPKVEHAVRNGVNVVIWAFCELVSTTVDHVTTTTLSNNNVTCVCRFDRDCAKEMIDKLDAEGYHHVVHLVSFGGWNGPHLPTGQEWMAEDMYYAWREHCGNIFHGVDWDLEGHDRLDSPTNVFSKPCLDCMGRFSELAKQDGYIIGMAPPQSYLDIDTSAFSRRVNLTDNKREWHSEFHYFGANVYAYLLAKYGTFIDFVSIQFYESYSRAGMEIYHHNKDPAEYLYMYVHKLTIDQQGSFLVDFEQDSSLDYASGNVNFPLTKLVFGFANGWAPAAGTDAVVDITNDKVCYFDPKQIAKAWKKIVESQLTPRGLMYWVM